jgi:hypothetical protein
MESPQHARNEPLVRIDWLRRFAGFRHETIEVRARLSSPLARFPNLAAVRPHRAVANNKSSPIHKDLPHAMRYTESGAFRAPGSLC